MHSCAALGETAHRVDKGNFFYRWLGLKNFFYRFKLDTASKLVEADTRCLF